MPRTFLFIDPTPRARPCCYQVGCFLDSTGRKGLVRKADRLPPTRSKPQDPGLSLSTPVVLVVNSLTKTEEEATLSTWSGPWLTMLALLVRSSLRICWWCWPWLRWWWRWWWWWCPYWRWQSMSLEIPSRFIRQDVIDRSVDNWFPVNINRYMCTFAQYHHHLATVFHTQSLILIMFSASDCQLLIRAQPIQGFSILRFPGRDFSESLDPRIFSGQD